MTFTFIFFLWLSSHTETSPRSSQVGKPTLQLRLELLAPSWAPISQFSSVQLLSHVGLLVTPWTAECQASLSITNSWSSPKLLSIESSSSSVIPFSSCPQSFPASGSFPVSQFFTSGGQSIGASASVLPINTQD